MALIRVEGERSRKLLTSAGFSVVNKGMGIKMANLLEVNNLKKYFPVRSGLLGLTAVGCVLLTGLVSLWPWRDSGVGGRIRLRQDHCGSEYLRLIEPTGGEVFFQGVELTALSKRRMRALRPKMQVVSQDPYSSLNPRMVVLDLVGEGLSEHGLARTAQEKKDLVVEVLERVGLSADFLYRYPHEFSGGQRQRIAIARRRC